MHRSSVKVLVGVVAVVGLLIACQSGRYGVDAAALGSVAHITSTSPDTTRVLRPGERVRLSVNVKYVLTAESGTIKLVVLAADNSDLSQVSQEITRGRGAATLDAEFTVPTTSVIRLYTPLVVQGRAEPPLADGRAFEVVTQ